MRDVGGFSERFVVSLKARDAAAQTDYFTPNPKYRGLAIRVAKSGRKTWSFVFTWAGKRARMTLGTHPALSVAEAHLRAIEARSYLEEKPPRDPRRIMAPMAGGGMTVKALVECYLKLRVEARVARKSDGILEDGLRNAPNIRWMLNRHVVPVIGSILLSDLHTRDVNRVLDSIIARGTLIAAARTFQMMRAMFRWAVGRGYLDRAPTDNMACPAESRPRERTLSPEEIRTFWHNLHKAVDDVALQRILKLQLVLGQRVGEVAGMAKAELDLERRLWTIPPSRTKNKHEHVLPLPPLAIEIIREALVDAGDSAFVFPSKKTGIAFPSGAVSIAVVGAYKKIGIGHFTSHDLRRTCADSMDALGVLDTIIGRVLNHRSVFKSTVTQRHYVTRSYEREMRETLELWAKWLRTIIEDGGVADIIPLRR